MLAHAFRLLRQELPQNAYNRNRSMDLTMAYQIPKSVLLALEKGRAQKKRLALLTCGISGSGKSSLARNIVTSDANFLRLSIDAYVFDNHGVYDVDYPNEQYEGLQEEAERELKTQLTKILRAGERDVVIDYSFYSKETRDEYREQILTQGCGKYHQVLVVFRGDKKTLWKRIEKRRIDTELASSRDERREGMSISYETLNMYWKGFEWPNEEGEIIVPVE